MKREAAGFIERRHSLAYGNGRRSRGGGWQGSSRGAAWRDSRRSGRGGFHQIQRRDDHDFPARHKTYPYRENDDWKHACRDGKAHSIRSSVARSRASILSRSSDGVRAMLLLSVIVFYPRVPRRPASRNNISINLLVGQKTLSSNQTAQH